MIKEKIDKRYTVAMFFLFLFICMCSPLMGDDWGNFLNGSNGIAYSIQYAFSSYYSYEGRIMSRIFINILTYNKFLWNILNPLIISLIYYFCLKIITRDDNYITPTLMFLAFLFVDVEGFRQVYVWLAGNITYLFPMILIFYLLYLNRNLTFIVSKIEKISLPLVTFVFSLFVENASIVIVFCYLFFVGFYYVKNRKIEKSLLASFILALIGTLIMLLSPGNSNRLDTYPEFTSLSVIGKLIYNIPNFINYTFIRNSFLVLLFSVVILYTGKERIKCQPIKYFIWLYATIVPGITAFYNYLITLGIKIYILEIFLNYQNIAIIFFWVIYTFIALLLVGNYIVEKKDLMAGLLIVVGFLSNSAMMISPVWGGRTGYLTAICVSTGLIKIIQNFDIIRYDNKIVCFLSNTVLALMIILLLVGYRSVYINNLNREEYIRSQLASGNEIIEIKILSERFLWNPNPWNDEGDGYLARTIKRYYNIPSDRKIVMVE